MTAMKLQKLVYYCQAWHLVFDETRLFKARIEAWANGPVVESLYKKHKGKLHVSAEDLSDGDASALTDEELETVDEVLRFYGEKSAQWLSDLTHTEIPWIEARNGMEPGERGKREIKPAKILEYYHSLSRD